MNDRCFLTLDDLHYGKVNRRAKLGITASDLFFINVHLKRLDAKLNRRNDLELNGKALKLKDMARVDLYPSLGKRPITAANLTACEETLMTLYETNTPVLTYVEYDDSPINDDYDELVPKGLKRKIFNTWLLLELPFRSGGAKWYRTYNYNQYLDYYAEDM